MYAVPFPPTNDQRRINLVNDDVEKGMLLDLVLLAALVFLIAFGNCTNTKMDGQHG
jgi:hypothetical protein